LLGYLTLSSALPPPRRPLLLLLLLPLLLVVLLLPLLPLLGSPLAPSSPAASPSLLFARKAATSPPSGVGLATHVFVKPSHTLSCKCQRSG
jgi:hypothetical protein